MEIVTWNVNSVRARLPRLLPWLEESRPEVVCLQETKVVDELFPLEPFEELGYQVAVHGRKTYNGVAILSRVGLEDVRRGLGDEGPDERRVIGATVAGGVQVLCVYVVNGQSVGSEKYAHKLEWLGRLRALLERDYDCGREQVVLCGDFNVTFDDRDVYDPEAWRDKILCSQPERDALAQVMDVGLVDALRHFTEEGEHYTWWDFRSRAWRGNRGLRIDHHLLSNPALEVCRGVRIDRDARDGEKPSDHAPGFVSLEV